MNGNICNKCNKYKPFTDFYENKRLAIGHNYSCKECESAYQLEYKRKRRSNALFAEEERKKDRERSFKKADETKPNRQRRKRKY
jgi:hypothetical protein